MEIEEKLKMISEKQVKCDHLGDYRPAGQQSFADQAKQIMVLITTVMCVKCGMLFFDQQDTTIRLRVNIIPAAPVDKKEEKEKVKEKN